MKQITLIVTFFSIFFCAIKAQISTEELPYSWGRDVDEIVRQSIPMVTLPSLDMEAINKEDLENEEGSGSPVRFGFPHEVNLSLSNSGTWETISDGGRLWTLGIYSPDALSLNLLYDKFWLPDGAKFFIYSEDREQHIGAFTSRNNSGENKEANLGFATGFLFTKSIILEYYEPAGVDNNGVISISQIISGYRYIYDIVGTRHNTTDYPCHNDVNCPEGDDCQQEKNAVAYMVMGGYSCTGALLNTTANDNRPVFLTANHCFEASVPIAQWIFYWNYEVPICDGGAVNPASNKSTTGANVLARRADTDFMLLNLTSDPALNPNVTLYYLGWDRRNLFYFPKGFCIHHPRGAQKKISITNSINHYLSIICWDPMCYSFSPADTHWEVFFSNGTVEKGSSGSPLLNQDKQVIGQLHGGTNGCPPGVVKYYGRFDLSWDGSSSSVRLKEQLDPLNTGVTILNGTHCTTLTNFTNQTVTTNTTITTGCSINVQNVTVTTGATLTLDAAGSVTLGGGFEMQPGSGLEIK